MRYLLFTLLVLSLAFSALGQTPTGTLQGTVVDESGAVMPNSTVRVTSESTNETKTLTTNSLGAFFLPFVTPGTYTVSVTRPGFSVLEEKGIEIQVDQIRALNLVMKVGAVTQTVEVQGTAPRLDTQTGTLGQVVDTTLSMDMPLLGRDPISLAKLAPAVNQTGYADNPHLGGSRNGINEEQLDGVSNILPENNLGVGTVAYTPIVDSVQEFSVETNALSAEYGRFGGGVINMVTKQGTNRFHGDGFEFAQNAALDANDFFSNSANSPIPASHENQYGGTAGGPIDIPHVYNGHDRTFFFFGFQATQQESATNGIFTVPTAAFRAGDFSSLGTTIYDPLTINPATDTRSAFPSNQIPQNRWDAVGAKAMSYFPLPNYGAPGAQTNNYFNSGSTLNDLYQFDIRVDHTFSAKWQSFLRFSHNWSHYTTFSQYNNPASPNSGPGHSDAYSVSMDHTFTLSPTLILDLRYGLSRNAGLSTALDQGFNPSTELGFPSYVAALASQRVLMFPDFFFSNGASLGNIYSYYSEEPTLDNFVANVTKVKGHHTLKFGGELRTMWENFAQYGYPDGGFDIDTTWTQLNPTVANGTGSPYADLLLGLTGTSASVLGLPGYTGSVQTAEPSATDHSSYMGYYLQDNWKLTKKLTLNLGLRWELEIPRTDRFNQLLLESQPCVSAGGQGTCQCLPVLWQSDGADAVRRRHGRVWPPPSAV